MVFGDLHSKLTFPLCYNFLNMGRAAEGKKIPGSDEVDYSQTPMFIQVCLT
jgi:hypothetical protein